MTNSTTDTDFQELKFPQPALAVEQAVAIHGQDTIDFLDGGLHLASDNPQPDSTSNELEPVSASIRMASYRLAAVFGELSWVNPNAA